MTIENLDKENIKQFKQFLELHKGFFTKDINDLGDLENIL
jgi:hypothetical protein